MLLPDALTDILQSIHLQSTILGTANFTAPWSIRIPTDDDDEATIHVVMQGQCWLLLEARSQPIHLKVGDLVILLQGQEHILCDDPVSPTVELEAVIARKPDPGYKRIAYGGNGTLSQLVSGTFKFRGDRYKPIEAGTVVLMGSNATGKIARAIRMNTRIRSNKRAIAFTIFSLGR